MKVSCSIAFTVQISASIHKQIYPDETVAKTRTTHLGKIDFPAAFKVCIKPSFNATQIWLVGYNSTYSYFTGRSKFARGTTGVGKYGWAGHTQDGGVFSNVTDVQNRIFLDYHSVIKGIVVVTNKVLWGYLPITSLKLHTPNYPSNCLTLDIIKHLTPGEILERLIVTFDPTKFATDVDVVIEDRLTMVDRTLLSSRKSPINYDSIDKSLTKDYLVSFHQDIFLDSDRSECVNYPTDKYTTFNDCDRQYLDKLYAKKNTYPAWATPEDLTLATNLTIATDFRPSTLYFMGRSGSPCVEPCKQTTIMSAYQQTDKPLLKGRNYPSVVLNFNQKVRVTTHAMPSFHPLEVLQVDQEFIWL